MLDPRQPASLSAADILRVSAAVRFAERFDRARGNGAGRAPGGTNPDGPAVWPLKVTADSDGGFQPARLQTWPGGLDLGDLGDPRAGRLTTRTGDDAGVVTLAAGHAIRPGDAVDLAWAGGSRTRMTAAVHGLEATLDGGSGDNLPAADTPVTASTDDAWILLVGSQNFEPGERPLGLVIGLRDDGRPVFAAVAAGTGGAGPDATLARLCVVKDDTGRVTDLRYANSAGECVTVPLCGETEGACGPGAACDVVCDCTACQGGAAPSFTVGLAGLSCDGCEGAAGPVSLEWTGGCTWSASWCGTTAELKYDASYGWVLSFGGATITYDEESEDDVVTLGPAPSALYLDEDGNFTCFTGSPADAGFARQDSTGCADWPETLSPAPGCEPTGDCMISVCGGAHSIPGRLWLRCYNQSTGDPAGDCPPTGSACCQDGVYPAYYVGSGSGYHTWVASYTSEGGCSNTAYLKISVSTCDVSATGSNGFPAGGFDRWGTGAGDLSAVTADFAAVYFRFTTPDDTVSKAGDYRFSTVPP